MREPSESWSDNSLLYAAMRGDNQAFALFCQQSLPKLRLHVSQLCRSYKLDQSLVGDFCNDTIVRALDYIKDQQQSASNRPNPIRNADAWIKTIAGNIVIDFVRKVARLKEQPLSSDAREAISPLDLEEVVELEDLFDTLTNRERQVMHLLYIDRLTVSDAAESLGINEEAIRKAHQRALQRLKKGLEGR